MSFGGNGGGSSIAGATDVLLNSPQNNDYLGYDTASAKWQNKVASAGGGGAGVAPATKVVAANDAPANVKAAADYVCTGTADEVVINQAIAAVASDAIGLGTQGGSVLLWGKQFNTAGAIKMRSQVTLRGQGQWATTIKPAASYQPGATGGVIELYSGNSQYSTVMDLAIHGNGWAGSAYCCGIYYNQTGGTEWDAAHRIMNVYIYATGSHGIHLQGSATGRGRAYYVANVRIIDAGTTADVTANGLFLDLLVDSFFFGVDIGSSASHGIAVTGANNRFMGCKSWFSGSLATTNHGGSGFYITGVRNEFSGCESQDNYGDGYYISGPDNGLSSCTADSNGYNRNGGNGTGGWTGSGFYAATARLAIQGNAFDKNEGNRGIYQKYAVELAGSYTGTLINVVSGVSGIGKLGGTADMSSIVNVV